MLFAGDVLHVLPWKCLRTPPVFCAWEEELKNVHCSDFEEGRVLAGHLVEEDLVPEADLGVEEGLGVDDHPVFEADL